MIWACLPHGNLHWVSKNQLCPLLHTICSEDFHFPKISLISAGMCGVLVVSLSEDRGNSCVTTNYKHRSPRAKRASAKPRLSNIISHLFTTILSLVLGKTEQFHICECLILSHFFSPYLEWDLQIGQFSRQSCQILCLGLQRNHFVTANHPWNCKVHLE